MSNYKVTEKDLIGELKGFPIEVVEKMLERQREQTGTEDITIFQNNSITLKGFVWKNTIEGCSFWNNVIFLRDFNLFFKKYPKKNKYVYIYQDDTKDGKAIINILIKHGGINKLSLKGASKDAIYYIRPDDNVIVATHQYGPEARLVKRFYTEIQPESSVKEYTMQEIADKLGINVNELRIKK